MTIERTGKGVFLINLTFYESGTVYCAVNEILARELLKTSQVHTHKRVLLSPLCFLILISLIYNSGCFETCDQRDQNEDHSLMMPADISVFVYPCQHCHH